MRSTRCPVLIGRDAELRNLAAALDEAGAGHGGAVFLTGDAGVGKSRLAQEAAALAAARGFDVLTGRAAESAVPVPYRPLTEALLRSARSGVAPKAAELDDYRPALGSLVPEWRRPEDDAAEISAVILGEAVLRLLTPRGSKGALLVLEDLHWADPETLEIVDYLADNLTGTRVLFVATVRSAEPSACLQFLRSACARRAATAIEVRRLAEPAVAQMAAACLGATEVPRAITRRLLANCDGLPFAVEEILAEAISSGELTSGAAGWQVDERIRTGVPASITGSVRDRLAALDRLVAEVVVSAAVLGKRFDWTMLPRLAGVTEREALAALQQAREMQLIEPLCPDQRTFRMFRFRHSLTRDAILSGLLPPDVASRSASAAAAIEDLHPGLPGPWCERAAELHAAAGDLVRASQLQLESGRRACRLGALSSSIASLKDARELLAAAPHPEPALAMDIDEALVNVLSLAGDYRELAPLAENLIAALAATSADPRREARIRIFIASAPCEDHCAVAGRHLSAARNIAEGLRDPALIGQVDATSARCAFECGDFDRAGELAQRSLAIAEASLPDRWAAAVAVESLQVIGRLERLRDLRSAEVAFERAYQIATGSNLAISRINTMHELGTIDMLRDSKVGRLLEARELAHRSGAISISNVIDLQLAHALTHTSDLDRALSRAKQCEHGASLLAARRVEAFALCAQAIIWGVRGDRPMTERAASRAELILPGDPELLLSTWGTARATASLFLDDLPRALREAKSGVAYGGQLALQLPRRAWAYYAILHVIFDDNGYEALKQAEDAGAAAGWSEGFLAFAGAVLDGREGRADRASELAEAGAAHLAPYAPRWTHLAHRLVAPAAIKDGWGEPAVWLRDAAVEFDASSHHRLASSCRAILRRAGARVPRAGRGDAQVPVQMRRLGVTSREMDVFLLVARGLSNAEIAARLFISPKTVETHVASLIAKTGQACRRELVAHAARLAPPASR